MRSRLFWIFVFFVCFGTNQRAEAAHRCRPCGPESAPRLVKWFIPQGVAGADFRPACRHHDQCYATPGVDRAACDCQFLNEMLAQCAASRNPRRCHRVACRMYRAVRKYGQHAFERAQNECAEISDNSSQSP